MPPHRYASGHWACGMWCMFINMCHIFCPQNIVPAGFPPTALVEFFSKQSRPSNIPIIWPQMLLLPKRQSAVAVTTLSTAGIKVIFDTHIRCSLSSTPVTIYRRWCSRVVFDIHHLSSQRLTLSPTLNKQSHSTTGKRNQKQRQSTISADDFRSLARA